MSGKRKEKDRLEVFDPLRKRFVALTPEEEVRQKFVYFLIHERHYPAALLGNEVSITLNGLSKRCDTVLLGKDGLPQMIIEYKRPSVALTQRVFADSMPLQERSVTRKAATSGTIFSAVVPSILMMFTGSSSAAGLILKAIRSSYILR